jgi:hypothetical protein
MRPQALIIFLFAMVAAPSLIAFGQTKTPGGAPESAQPAGSASAPPVSSAPQPSAAIGAATSPVGSAGAQAPIALAPAPSASVSGATYTIRLRDLEQRVDELKDQIRRSHTRLALLSDTILGGGTAGCRSEVEFKNEMSSAFLLTRAQFLIDNQLQANRQDESGALSEQKDIPIYSGTVPPGDHTIVVDLTFQGNGYGIFSYLRGYKFEVKSSHSFTAIEGKNLVITATAFEKGGVTTPLEQRPQIDWHETLRPFTSGSLVPPVPSGGGGVSASAGGSVSLGGGSKK